VQEREELGLMIRMRPCISGAWQKPHFLAILPMQQH
jgi:hypothetical protein